MNTPLPLIGAINYSLGNTRRVYNNLSSEAKESVSAQTFQKVSNI